MTVSFQKYGHLCVGIDPHPWLLDAWGLGNTAAGAQEFGLRVIEAAAGRVGVIKPQVAFFERFGSGGYVALERVICEARSAGLLVIADAKRGDVGSSLEGYARAWLTPGSPLESDAMTVSAFQGVGSLDAALALAQSHEKGVFILCATSNPEAAMVQKAVNTGGDTVSASIAHDVVEANALQSVGVAGEGLGSIGLVVGATVAAADYGIDLGSLATTPLLAPGFGFQGAQFGEIPARYGRAAPAVLAAVSRSVLEAGPDKLATAITTQGEELAKWLR